MSRSKDGFKQKAICPACFRDPSTLVPLEVPGAHGGMVRLGEKEENPMDITNSARQRRWFLGALLLAATVTALPFAQAVAFAQMPAGGMPNPGGMPAPAPAPENPASMGANPEQDSMQNMVDQAFVRNTMENDEAQIRLSQLAQQKAASPDLKQFSQQMVKVHTELDTQLKPVAGHLGVSEPRKPSRKEKKEIQQLQGLSGQQFDAAYLEAMAREQRQSLKLFHDEVKDTGNHALLQAAKADTPVIAQNLQILQQIAQSHNVDIEGKEK